MIEIKVQNIISIIFFIISISLIIYGYNESKIDNTKLYGKINAKIYDIEYITKQISNTIVTNKIRHTTYKPAYDIYYKYKFIIGKIEYKSRYFVRRAYNFGEVEFYRKKMYQRPTKIIYYLKSNPNITSVEISKNNSVLLYVLGSIIGIFGIIINFAQFN